MPRYHFNVREGSTFIPDDEGMRLDNIDAARFEAREGARDFIVEALIARQEVDGRTIEITNNDGEVLDTLKVRDILN